MPYKDKHQTVENTRKWRLENREKYLETTQHWRDNNKEKIKEQAYRWRQANIKKARGYGLKWYYDNKDKARDWKESHYEQVLLCKRKWAHRNREYLALQRSLWRARQRELGADLTNGQWQSIKEAYNYRCAYCGTTPKRLEKDHVIPIKNGGATTASNIVPCCPTCNRKKSCNEPIKLPALRIFI